MFVAKHLCTRGYFSRIFPSNFSGKNATFYFAKLGNILSSRQSTYLFLSVKCANLLFNSKL
jgi:hypothetical protein